MEKREREEKRRTPYEIRKWYKNMEAQPCEEQL